MRKALAVAVLTLLVLPSTGLAGGWRHGPRHRHIGDHRPFPRHQKFDGQRINGAAIAAGVLGSIVTGVILDRILTPAQPTHCCRTPAPQNEPVSVSPGYGDPYDRGYQQGYRSGVERGRAERYQQGQRQGYNQGFDDAASGRIWASTSP